MRTAGPAIALGSLLLLAAVLLHPPEGRNAQETLPLVATHANAVAAFGFLEAAACALVALGAFLALQDEPRPQRLRRTAWALIALFMLAFLPAPILGGTALVNAARNGDAATFSALHAFAAGLFLPLLFALVGVGLLAWSEARSPHPATARWAGYAATALAAMVLAGVAATLGLSLPTSSWLRPLQAAFLPLLLWTAWLGLRLPAATT